MENIKEGTRVQLTNESKGKIRAIYKTESGKTRYSIDHGDGVISSRIRPDMIKGIIKE